MTAESFDPEIAALAEQLDAQRPRPSHTLRQRVRGVLVAGLRERALRRQSVWLVTSGAIVIAMAAVLAIVTSP